jgi:hypothetical protein
MYDLSLLNLWTLNEKLFTPKMPLTQGNGQRLLYQGIRYFTQPNDGMKEN